MLLLTHNYTLSSFFSSLKTISIFDILVINIFTVHELLCPVDWLDVLSLCVVRVESISGFPGVQTIEVHACAPVHTLQIPL